MDFSTFQRLQLAPDCHDLGCWTFCNGTDRILKPCPIFDWEEFFFFITPFFLVLGILALLYLLILYIVALWDKYWSPVSQLVISVIFYLLYYFVSPAPPPPSTPPPPNKLTVLPSQTPSRKKVRVDVEVQSGRGKRGRAIMVTANTPQKVLKREIVQCFFPELNLEDKMSKYRLYCDQILDMDPEMSLHDYDIDKDGVKLILEENM